MCMAKPTRSLILVSVAAAEAVAHYGVMQEKDRFGGREDLVRALQNCARSVQSDCEQLRLQQCQETFPSMYHIELLHHQSSVSILFVKIWV